MATRKTTPKGVASLNPDLMIGGGLADDFDGEIVKVRYVPWNYGGSVDHYSLAAAVTIAPDEDSGWEEFTQYYSAGKLDDFVPSPDGEDGVDLDSWDGDEDTIEEVEGVYALRVGKKEQLSNSSNWHHFLRAAIDAGFPVAQLDADVSCLEGVRGHFNRIPQQKRSGIVVQPEEGGETRQRTILILTEVDSDSVKGGKSKAASKRKTTTKKRSTATTATRRKKAADEEPEDVDTGDTGEGDGDDLDTRISEAVLEALAENDGELPKAKLPGVILKAFAKGPDKAKAIKRVGNVAFLSGSDDWEYDADEAVLTFPE